MQEMKEVTISLTEDEYTRLEEIALGQVRKTEAQATVFLKESLGFPLPDPSERAIKSVAKPKRVRPANASRSSGRLSGTNHHDVGA